MNPPLRRWIGIALLTFGALLEFPAAVAGKAYISRQMNGDLTGRRKGEFDGVFRVPAGLEDRVRFWIKVYGEHTSDQVLMHDARDLRLIYDVLDFSFLKAMNLSPYEKEKIREKAIERRRKELIELLHRFDMGSISFQELGEKEWAVYRLLQRTGMTRFAGELASRGRVRSQDGLKDRFQEGLARSGRYLPLMEAIFLEHNLPWQLTRLAFVESMFHPRAYSKVGAAGIWQLMRATGRRYLRIDEVIDERLDPIMASAAAAKYLSENYDLLQSWPLAITAYNHGHAGMMRAVNNVGSSDLGEIVESYDGRAFGFASQNFYSEFLAALQVEQNSQQYFGSLQRDPPLVFDTAEVKDYVAAGDLAQFCNQPLETLQQYNPSLTQAVWRGEKLIPKGSSLRLPRGQGEGFSDRYAQLPQDLRRSQQKPSPYYRVQRGDTLHRIALRYGLGAASLAAYNGLGMHSRIRPGQRLRLPLSASLASSRGFTQTAAVAEPKVRSAPIDPEFIQRYLASLPAAEMAPPPLEGGSPLPPALAPGAADPAPSDADRAALSRLYQGNPALPFAEPKEGGCSCAAAAAGGPPTAWALPPDGSDRAPRCRCHVNPISSEVPF